MRVVDRNLAFIFLFCSALSYASEVGKFLSPEKINNLKTNKLIKSADLENNNFALITLDSDNLFTSDLHQSQDRKNNKLAPNKQILQAVRIAAVLVEQISNRKGTNTLSSMFDNAIDKYPDNLDIFNYALSIDDGMACLLVARKNQIKTPGLNQVLFFNAAIEHSNALCGEIISNALKYEQINNSNSSKELTFVYDGFNYQELLKQVEALNNVDGSCFSMVISHGESFGVAIFHKASEGNIERILIGGNESTKKLVTQIADSIQKKTLKNFIARFIVAHRSSLVAMQELKSLGIGESDPLFCACVKKENNEKTVNDLLEKNKELNQKNTDLKNQMLSLEERNSLLQAANKNLEEEKNTLNATVLNLNAKVTINRQHFWSTIWSSFFSMCGTILGGLFSGGRGPAVLVMLYFWWKFSPFI